MRRFQPRLLHKWCNYSLGVPVSKQIIGSVKRDVEDTIISIVPVVTCTCHIPVPVVPLSLLLGFLQCPRRQGHSTVAVPSCMAAVTQTDLHQAQFRSQLPAGARPELYPFRVVGEDKDVAPGDAGLAELRQTGSHQSPPNAVLPMATAANGKHTFRKESKS
jgi:hypothetical protein